MIAKMPPQPGTMATAACPHVVFADVLGSAMVAELLEYVAARQADFREARVRNRKSGQRRVDYGVRSSMSLPDLGCFKVPFESYVRGITPSLFNDLKLAELPVQPKDFAIAAYRDGGYFAAHIDTDERVARVRVLSCVYYFSATPRRFSGGELRIYGMPTLSAAKGGQAPFVDVVPETDTLIVFPSWLRHEVLPVSVPSGAWLDSRFTINCWLHRTV